MATDALGQLVELFALEALAPDRFRGGSQDLGFVTLFGGQVLGQALAAASRTVPAERAVHSLHGYFLRAGDPTQPIDYAVEALRDGGSFTTRRVLATQGDAALACVAASFHGDETSFDHQDPAPQVAGPEGLASDEQRLQRLAAHIPEPLRDRLLAPRGIELRGVDPIDPLNPRPAPARKHIWMRASGPLPDDPVLHRCLLAYASDFGLVGTALRPHGEHYFNPALQVVSLDHALWFHRPFRLDDWLLHAMESPTASGARGLNRGQIFDARGRLVASTVQEGLLRRRGPARATAAQG